MIWKLAKDLDLPEFWPYGRLKGPKMKMKHKKQRTFIISSHGHKSRTTWTSLKLRKIKRHIFIALVWHWVTKWHLGNGPSEDLDLLVHTCFIYIIITPNKCRLWHNGLNFGTPTSWIMWICFTQISLTRLFKRFPFLT